MSQAEELAARVVCDTWDSLRLIERGCNGLCTSGHLCSKCHHEAYLCKRNLEASTRRLRELIAPRGLHG